MGRRSSLALAELSDITAAIQQRFQKGRRLLSFQQYLELFAANPACHGRDATRYVRDMFDHFGTYPIKTPRGESVRYRLFDLPWEPEAVRQDKGHKSPAFHGRDAALVGHEELQGEIYRVLSNFVQEGRANRLILMHGPNGSAKSTVASCILRGLEHYSTLEEGALYRFHWVFPTRKTTRGSIGFGGENNVLQSESFAHLDDAQIDARLVIELRDHPLFLLPIPERRTLVQKLYDDAGISDPPPDWLMSGKLSHKNQQIVEALLASYGGSLVDVLRHVQVERWFVSRRYRIGAVTLGPELSVDAGERQITADRSLAALPTALQARTLFEAHGEIVEAAGGVLEFSDLLKRPLDAFRYLQLTLETGEVSLPQQTIQTNVVMIGSANDVHLNAFRQHPEFPSFRGRFELLRAPYLRSWPDEQRIYDAQIVPFVRRHVAPHATRVAAQFAVLTRMRQPDAKKYPEGLAVIVSSLTAAEKLEMYASGNPPECLDTDAQKLLRANVRALYCESDAALDFEGSLGVSPREMRGLLLDAAQLRDAACLSPFAVLTELDELCKRTSEFEWLNEEALEGGYHDHKLFREIVRAKHLDKLEEEMRAASGIVDEVRHHELFDRYIVHVGAMVKQEKLRNAHTGQSEPADERMMQEVEGLLGAKGKPEDYRKGLISMIAAWAIDHPGEKIVNAVVFPQHLRRLREAFFADRRKAVALLCRDLVGILRDRVASGTSAEVHDGKNLRDEQYKNALAAFGRLQAMGYCEHCALEGGSALLRARFAELVT